MWVGERRGILVVDDDVLAAALVCRILEHAGFVVRVAYDGLQALAAVARDAPQLVVLDVMLPGIDGYEVCRALRAKPGHGPMVLMLAARHATRDRVTGLDAGADDYLGKPFECEELLARIRALLRRAPVPTSGSPTTLHLLVVEDLCMDVAAREVRRGDRLITFTALEFDLLAYFMRQPRLVLTRHQLIDAVWAGRSGHTSNVVDVYVRYLRTKIEYGGGPRLLHTVRGVGYVLRPGQP